MHDTCQNLFPDTDIAIMCAAVADYAPAQVATHKIKRENQEVPVIELVKNPDIAASLGKIKRHGQMLVGFALETDNEQANAEDKIRRKNLDMIVLNSLRNPGTCFGTDRNKVSIITLDGACTEYPDKSKTEVAHDIIDAIVSRINK